MGNGKGISIESILQVKDVKLRDRMVLEMQFQTYENVNKMKETFDGEIQNIVEAASDQAAESAVDRKDIKWLKWAVRAMYVAVMSMLGFGVKL